MNPLSIPVLFFGKGPFKYTMILSGIALILGSLYLNGFTHGPLSFALWCLLIILSSIVIWRAGDFFSPAAKMIEDHYNLPQSVKAAVIDAIASSFPEFVVAVSAVMILGQAEVGIATIVGSALYNVLIIPAAVGIVAISPVVISKEVVWRDNLVYILVVLFLLGAVLLFPNEWGIGIALAFLGIYVGYVLLLHAHHKRFKKQQGEAPVQEKIEVTEKHKIGSVKEAVAWIIGMMILMALASQVLVEASIAMGELLGVHNVLMAFVVIAAGTSVPDMDPSGRICSAMMLTR